MAWYHQLNVFRECRELRWGLWYCPPFLFLILGVITIASILLTYAIASRYGGPEIVVVSVTAIAIVFLTLGNLIIAGFNKIAEANRMKSEFISLISHQLRSPLSIFKWTLDVMERGLKNNHTSDHETANFLSTLRSTSESMIRLVNTLLDASRIEADTFLLRKEYFSLKTETQSALNDFRRYAEASNIALVFTGPDVAPDIYGDRERIGMVIQNLIDNAIKYTKRAGTVTITLKYNDTNFHWSIHDEGVGIPPGQQQYIFQKFFRARNAQQNQTHGTGIGLYIAKAIIEASGGTIGFLSKEHQGSTFWFTLPITPTNQKH